MTIPTPAADYRTLYAWLGAFVGDTTDDPDGNPDWVPATEGTITFTPNLSTGHVSSSDGVTLGGVPFPIVCQINKNGQLTYLPDASDPSSVVASVTVVDLGSDKVNPQIPRDKAAYNVSFAGVKLNGATVKIASFGINPGPDDEDENGQINLFDLQPLPTGNGGATIVRGMGLPSITSGTDDDVATIVDGQIKWASVPAPSTDSLKSALDGVYVPVTRQPAELFSGPAPTVQPLIDALASGTEYVWNETDGEGALVDIITGVAS